MNAPGSRRDLRELRKRLLVAESMLMRERLARDLQRGLRPAHRLMHSLAMASAALPLRPIAWALFSWFLGHRRRKRPDSNETAKKEKKG